MKMNNQKVHQLSIAMFGHKKIPSNEGGIEVVVEQLSIRMVKLGHFVTCWNRSGNHVAGSEFNTKTKKEYKGIRLKRVFTLPFTGLAAVSSSFLASFGTAFGKYDIVHIHAEGPAFMCWLPKLMGKKVVVTIHGLDHQRAKWGRLASAYIMRGEKNAVRFADEIIVLSQQLKQYFWDTYQRQTVYIANGVNPPKICEADEIIRKWGLQKDSYILYLGRIVPEKGEKNLIKAFKNVDTDKKLVIAGGSSDTDTFMKELQQLANDDERIIFTGFVQGKLKSELYSNAYIYTLPSDLEGMPLSLLEGMSYGNCCLTSDIAECTEVVEDKAIIFKKGNVEDLTEKLQELCDNPDCVQKYKSQSQAFILGKYNWDSVVKETLAVYENNNE